MRGKVTETLLTADQIQKRVAELGAQINEDYKDTELFGVCLLKGSIIFCADLVRHLTIPVRVDVMRASSYGGGTESSGSVKILQDLDVDISGKDVLIIEDIVDTGRTLHRTLELLSVRHPSSLKVCSLLDKPSRRVVDVDIAYTGFTIEDKFVIGYGLDYDEYFRNLPYIGVLDPNG
ncbi:hypoxanthine phosphoribosyltransferase [Acanthopleuribacter pedis]|uniref:Hypoxanthine phosphoribosyltransferase n=1 Tax=Acanthopleuribacter pedis TaxID=442870 RepID=A0A8J7Q9F9_9BACT|nr:hypoxanthine phosphoribosyltransferase [Acanthopleuribacter pedis]MBO1320172.1 hypoxanthine phosphoribosyltransferase [Acanthopleuribacter pedis]